MHQQSWWLDFKIFALNVEFLPVGADAVAPPPASGPHVHRGFDDVIQARLPPPFGELGRVADRLKDTGWRRCDENLGNHSVLVRGDCGGRHRTLLQLDLLSFSCYCSINFFSISTTPGHPPL